MHCKISGCGIRRINMVKELWNVFCQKQNCCDLAPENKNNQELISSPLPLHELHFSSQLFGNLGFFLAHVNASFRCSLFTVTPYWLLKSTTVRISAMMVYDSRRLINVQPWHRTQDLANINRSVRRCNLSLLFSILFYFLSNSTTSISSNHFP